MRVIAEYRAFCLHAQSVALTRGSNTELRPGLYGWATSFRTMSRCVRSRSRGVIVASVTALNSQKTSPLSFFDIWMIPYSIGSNVNTCFITCPADEKKTLGIKLPFLVMIIKNLKKYFTFEVQVLDDKGVRRRFRASNYQSTTRVKPFICTMPMRLDEGWNQIQFNLSDFTRRAYGTNYIETLRVQLHANCRIRRLYFSDRLYSEEELPPEFKLFLPIAK